MLLSQVKAMRDQLRPSERKLADYVIDAPREVLDLAMTDFATRAGVSQPTIARFCQALGFSGFREFKIRLAQSIASDVPAPAVFRDVRADEPAAGVAAKVLDRTIGALLQVRNSLSSDSVAAAIALLADARRIEFYGAGGSGIAALDVQHKFFRLGVPSVAYSDPTPIRHRRLYWALGMSSWSSRIPGAPGTYSTQCSRRLTPAQRSLQLPMAVRRWHVKPASACLRTWMKTPTFSRR